MTSRTVSLIFSGVAIIAAAIISSGGIKVNVQRPTIVRTDTVSLFSLKSSLDSVITIECPGVKPVTIHYPAKLEWRRDSEKNTNDDTRGPMRINVYIANKDQTPVFAMTGTHLCTVGHFLP